MDKEDIQKLEEYNCVADSKEVRMNLIKQLDNEEATLEDIQSQLKEIQKTAKKKGLFTQEQLRKENFSLEEAIAIANRQKIHHAHDMLLKKLPARNPQKPKKI